MENQSRFNYKIMEFYGICALENLLTYVAIE